MGSARHLYVVCIYGAICLQIQKYFPPVTAIFSPKNKILILLYIVYRCMQKIAIFHGKTGRYDVLKIKFVDISHHRYKLRRNIEQYPYKQFFSVVGLATSRSNNKKLRRYGTVQYSSRGGQHITNGKSKSNDRLITIFFDKY